MSIPRAKEQRMLTASEFEAVSRTHYPAICEHPTGELIDLARRVREYRDKARDITRHRRREQRGKAEPRGVGPAPSESGTAMKSRIFASAMKRLNSEIKRKQQGESRLVRNARRALEMKRANQVRHQPVAGSSAGAGMQPIPNKGDTVTVDPREVGRVSQAVKVAQVQRDS